MDLTKGDFSGVLLLFFFLGMTGILIAQDTGRNNISGIPSTSPTAAINREVTRIPDSVIISNKMNAFIKGIVSSRDVYSYHGLLHSLPDPVHKRYREREFTGSDSVFFLLLGLALLLGILRSSFPRYFNNLFRVFFNTSLRQTQLTEQLLETPLPSFLFNIFFILTVSLFVFLFLGYAGGKGQPVHLKFTLYATMLLSGIYLMKFCFVKFVGWVTGMQREANSYIFIVFLVNKVIGICLFPLLPLLAFSGPALVQAASFLACLVLVLMLSMRFLRTYGLASVSLRMDRFHFFLYIMALEVLPLLVLFKGAVILLDKNL